MSTIQWRPQINALTAPQSYRPQFVPRSTSGYNEMAADLSAAHPVYNAELIRSLAPLIMDWIQQQLINGYQVTLEQAFTFHLSFLGKLAGPDAPLPADKDILQVKVYPSRPFVQAVRKAARLERLPMNEKLPLITSSEDTRLKLADVLNPDGVLRLTGTNLYFNEEDPNCGCVLTGTESGEQQQRIYASISNTELFVVPNIPAQAQPWHNEYNLTMTTQYTEHGTPRKGMYRRRLRTPLLVDSLAGSVGLLTGEGAASPYAVISGGVITANERVRIQVLLDLRRERLLVNLIDMKEKGAVGEVVTVTANGIVSLPGFSGSNVQSLTITINNYAALRDLLRNHYSGRLVDILDVRTAS